nr:hypothetical protein [Tanacetum cinerariifolium]
MINKGVASTCSRGETSNSNTGGGISFILLYHEGMSILSGQKSVPGMNSRKTGKWKERLLGLHTESSVEQAFWSQYLVQTDEPNLFGTTIVEVPKELPKVSMVNSCLKKLKFHLTSFNMVVKERTTATAITEGTWGFENTKACFRDDIIPFVKSLKELFTSFDQCFIDEVTEVQNVFTQMEMAVEQHCEEKTKVQIKMENVLQENDRLLTQALSVEIVNIVVHENMKPVCLNVTACVRCVTTES